MTRPSSAALLAAFVVTGIQRLPAQTPTVVTQVSGTTSLLIGVSAVSEKVIWTSGQRGTVLRSVDGGDTWEKRSVPDAAALEFRDIHALSADLAWVMSAGTGVASKIYQTKDGGATWTLQFANKDSLAFYDCITFFDNKTGVAFSDAPDGVMRILRTDDGGDHWNLLPTKNLPPALKDEGGFAASGGCLVSNGPKNGWIAAGTPESRVFHTTDAGKTWSVAATPFVRAAQAGVTAVSFRDDKHGIGVGGRIGVKLDTTSAAVATTDDGGKTWTLRKRPPPGALFGVVWVPGAKGQTALASSLGGLMLTRDAGDSWSVVDTNQFWSVGAAGKFAWGVGPGGRIVRIEIRD